MTHIPEITRGLVFGRSKDIPRQNALGILRGRSVSRIQEQDQPLNSVAERNYSEVDVCEYIRKQYGWEE